MATGSDNYFISVVVPCYNEGANIQLVTEHLESVLKQYKYEIIFIDDGSTDGSQKSFEDLCLRKPNIYYIRFSRNFGHQAAQLAGIKHAIGDAIITIDADLQQPATLIPEMIDLWSGGAEIVETIPSYIDSVTWFKRYSSYLFYKILDKLTDHPVITGVNDFRLIDRKVAEVVKTLPENDLYLRGLFSWVGFTHKYINYKHLKRLNGRSHYSLSKLMKLATSGITSMSVRPLRFALIIGIIVSGGAFLIILWAAYIALFTDKAVPGWASTIISTVFLAGIQLLVLGIIGEYLGKLFMESKRRPAYVISATNLNSTRRYSVNNNKKEVLYYTHS